MKRGLTKFLIGASFLGLIACNTQKRVEEPSPKMTEAVDEVIKYALVVVGSGRGERGTSLVDPYDKNCFFLGGVKVYKHLKELGFEDKNMKFLYSTGNPDFVEKYDSETITTIKEKQFNGSYDNRATKHNLDNVIEDFSYDVDSNDVFAIYIGTHGSPAILEIEAGNEILWYHELQKMAEKVTPGYGILYVDSCHSGAYIKKMHLKNYVMLSTTGGSTYGWGDRDFSGGSFFFRNLSNAESDYNVDGRISVAEAFDKSKEEALEHMERIDSYLKDKYNWEGGSYENEIGMMSVVPEIIIGENVSGDYYFIDLHHFPEKASE
ncbi:MAG: C13 family peptidase [Candidatus Woesearchaeota archaeon]